MPLSISCENKTVLSSESRVYKTGLFIKETKNFRDLDLFLSFCAQGIILNYSKIILAQEERAAKAGFDKCFKIETEDKEHSFFFRFGFNAAFNKKDIIFFKYLGRESFIRKDDPRLRAYISQGAKFVVQPINAAVAEADFNKLYVLTNSANMHFPLLNEEQKGLVAIEDQNVLVQGVAGSGKTNVCIDKIIFSACRGYAGKVLYSTFSRGLLLDTQMRVKQFRQNLIDFIALFEKGNVVFADGNHKKAIENKLGIYFSVNDDDKILKKIKEVAAFLEEKVDYFLLEDLFIKLTGAKEIKIANENYFIKTYVRDIKNHQLSSKLEKVKHLSFEVIYKEIFGMINGCFNASKPDAILSLYEYCEKRQGSFSRFECEVIHSLALDYNEHLRKNNLLDNNIISRKLLQMQIEKYSLAVLDEVQDLTEVSLNLFKQIARKLFCVGDALQMINPSYFSFSYLKRLLFEKDIISVAELSHNYRSTERIARLTEDLGEINIRQFGTHSFVLKCRAVESDTPTLAAFVPDSALIKTVNNEGYNNYTVIVSSLEEKERLRKLLPNAEILTVAEVKGLERDVVILYNVLSANFDKWATLERMTVNRKKADENSVFRYYFNLFYVALSRARTHIYVVEEKNIPLFTGFFKESFANLTSVEAAKHLIQTSDKTQDEQDKLIERVAEFIRLEQFDNARFSANKIISESERAPQLSKIDIYESLVFKGKNKEAGIRLWEEGLVNEAKEQFIVAGEETLLRLLEACTGGDNKELSVDIISFLPEVINNDAAVKLIMGSLNKDLIKLTEKQKAIGGNLKKIRAAAGGVAAKNQNFTRHKEGV